MTTTIQKCINGIDTEALQQLADDIERDPRQGVAKFNVSTFWCGDGPRSETRVRHWSLGGKRHARDFAIVIDEPAELLGANTAANPQEFLFAAMNACIMATFVAACSVQGITLESLEIETEGELDLRGFLGLDKRILPGYDHISYTIRASGDGTQRQFEAVNQWVKNTSPNYFNLANAISLRSKLIVQ